MLENIVGSVPCPKINLAICVFHAAAIRGFFFLPLGSVALSSRIETVSVLPLSAASHNMLKVISEYVAEFEQHSPWLYLSH